MTLGCSESMKSKRHRSLKPRHQSWGAASVLSAVRGGGRGVTSRFPESSPAASSNSVSWQLGRVALFRSQLRSLLRRSVRGAFSVIAERSVAVRSESVGLPPSQYFQFGRLPNNSLAPTPVTNARFLSVGSGVAHRCRSARRGNVGREL